MDEVPITAEKIVHEIIPSPGPQSDWKTLEERINLLMPFAKTIHIDILDGKFAENKTILDAEPFKKFTQNTQVKFEVHLMVENPIQYLQSFADAGFYRFLGHIEKMPDQAEFVAQGQLLGEVGLAVDGPSGLEEINVPLDDLDALLCMSIKAGFSGQAFNPEFIDKMEMIKDTTWIPLEVDGGISDTTIAQAAARGATRFVSTSFIFNGNPEDQYNRLKKVLSSQE